MPALPHSEPLSPLPSFDAQAQVFELAEQVSRMLGVATAMVASGRRVDLAGLQQNVGVLCAKSLDLPPGRAGLAKAELVRVAASLDALTEKMRERKR